MWVEATSARAARFSLRSKPRPSSWRKRALYSARGGRQTPARRRKANATNQALLRRYTSAWGMRPTLVGTAAEALSLLRSGESFDLALFAEDLPDGDGFTCARCWRRRNCPPAAWCSTAASAADEGPRRRSGFAETRQTGVPVARPAAGFASGPSTSSTSFPKAPTSPTRRCACRCASSWRKATT